MTRNYLYNSNRKNNTPPTRSGEIGLSHGVREKSYSAYEEMTAFSLVVSNPLLYAEPVDTQASYSHLDLLPTLGELAGVPELKSYGLGHSIVPVLRDPSTSAQDFVLFSYEDVFGLSAGAPGVNLRALREGDWTYAVYFGFRRQRHRIRALRSQD